MRKRIINNVAKEIVEKNMSVKDAIALKFKVWNEECKNSIKFTDFSFFVELEVSKRL